MLAAQSETLVHGAYGLARGEGMAAGLIYWHSVHHERRQLRVLDIPAFPVEIGSCLATHFLLDPAHVSVDAGSAALVHIAGGLTAGHPVETVAPRGTEGKFRDQPLHVHAFAMLAGRLLVVGRSSDQY